MPSPTVLAIVQAWLEGDLVRAVALTNLWQRKQGQRVCKGVDPDGRPCERILFPQAKGDYCRTHRHQNPKNKAAVKRSRRR